MFKRFVFAFLFIMLISSVWGQSLQDNEYYRKMVQLKAQSETAFDEGDYEEAKRLADEAQGYKELSDQWIETQLTAYRARSSLNRLKERLAEVSRWNVDENYPEVYAEGMALYKQSYDEFFDEKDYVASLDTSSRGMEALAAVAYVPREGDFPAYYTVRLLPGNTDCLWNIAGYEFIYGDSLMWSRIYEANKSSFPEKDNPDFLTPGMVLIIPELSGENRSGTWVDGKIR